MLPAAGAAMMGSSPSFSSGATSGATGRSGDITSSYMSGDFTVGGDKNMIWIFVVAGAVAIAFFAFKGK